MAHQLLISDDEIIGQVIHSFEHYALGDIKKTSDQELIVAAFMLAACFIDQFAHQRYFKLISGTSEKFIAFVNAYFDGKHDEKSLCLDLRSRLVHNYFVTQSYETNRVF